MKIVCVWSPKGGVGKSTLTAHIADCLAIEHDKKVVVYDADPQRTFFHTWQAGSFSFEAIETMPDSPPECDYFIVDYPPTIMLSKTQKDLISASDFLIVPVRASRLDLDSAKAVKEIVPNHGKQINVLSCYDKRISDQQEVRQHLAANHLLVSYLSIYARTMNDFKTIYTRGTDCLHGTSRARAEIKNIVNKLLNN
jgi:cellulose biosynthesis protein BcsQ